MKVNLHTTATAITFFYTYIGSSCALLLPQPRTECLTWRSHALVKDKSEQMNAPCSAAFLSLS